MRKTLRRRWTELEQGRVRLMAEALWTHGSLGDGQLARAAGLSWAPRRRNRTRNAIRDLMPLLVETIVLEHPGYTAVRIVGGPVEITDDSDVARHVGLARLHKADTVLRRAEEELRVLAQSTQQTDRDMAIRARAIVLTLDDFARTVEQSAARLERDGAPMPEHVIR